MPRIDQHSALTRVVLREQRGIENLDEIHVAEKFFAIRHSEFDSLDTRMDVVGTVVAERLEVIAFEQIEGDQFGWSLAGRRILINTIPSVVDRDRCLDLGAVLREVLTPEQAAVAF